MIHAIGWYMIRVDVFVIVHVNVGLAWSGVELSFDGEPIRPWTQW